jgi:hypothetical protein
MAIMLEVIARQGDELAEGRRHTEEMGAHMQPRRTRINASAKALVGHKFDRVGGK